MRLKNRCFSNWKHQKTIFQNSILSLGKNLSVGRGNLSQTLFQAENIYESEGVPFDEIKVFSKSRTVPKNHRSFPLLLRKLSYPQDRKRSKRSPLGLGEVISSENQNFYEKKFRKNYFQVFLFSKFFDK